MAAMLRPPTLFRASRNAIRHGCVSTRRALSSTGPQAAGSLASTPLVQPPVHFDDGHVFFSCQGQRGNFSKLPLPWLRDHCQCPACFNASTKQRESHIADAVDAARVKNWTFSELSDTKGIHVEWEDGHQSYFDPAFLSQRTNPNTAAARKGLVREQLWDASIKRGPPSVDYHALFQGETRPLAEALRSHGICFVKDTPPTADATKKVMNLIGPLRDTHFGALHIVQPDINDHGINNDVAHSEVALDAHTDTTYFSDPVGLLALHLLSRDNVTGGASTFVDGFKVAKQLEAEDPQAYAALRDVRLFYHCSGNQGVNIQTSFTYPTLLHDTDNGRLTQVRWNNQHRAGFASDCDCDSIGRWYDAAKKYDKLLNDPANVYETQLQPGTMCIVDNWRILHGRRAFKGYRQLCTAYVPREDYIAWFKHTTYSPEQIMASTVTG